MTLVSKWFYLKTGLWENYPWPIGHLKFLSKRVCQGFQKTCYDAKESEEAEKVVFGP
jgi:hypothetical protein